MNTAYHPFSIVPTSSNYLVGKTFKEVADSYVNHGGDRRYLRKIIQEIGDQSMATLHPFDIQQVAIRLYPEHSAATRNRQALTPIRAVMNHGYDRGWCPLVRLRRFKEEKPKRAEPPGDGWMFAFIRQCEADNLPHLAAIAVFMSQTGARVSEAVALMWDQVDLVGRTALLLKTKTSTHSSRHLTDEIISRFYALGPRNGMRVFRFTNRHSVNERIRAVCRRAKIKYKPSHAIGRRKFATSLMAMGVDVKTAMDAGGWVSASVFLGTYVFTKNAGRVVSEKFNMLRYDEAV